MFSLLGISILYIYSRRHWLPWCKPMQWILVYCNFNCKAITFLGNRPQFLSVAIWNFNMGVNGKIVRCGMPWKRLIVEGNGKFVTQGSSVYIWGVLFMSTLLKFGWGHSVQFSKFPILRFWKHYLFNIAKLPFYWLSLKWKKKCFHLRLSEQKDNFCNFWQIAKKVIAYIIYI